MDDLIISHFTLNDSGVGCFFNQSEDYCSFKAIKNLFYYELIEMENEPPEAFYGTYCYHETIYRNAFNTSIKTICQNEGKILTDLVDDADYKEILRKIDNGELSFYETY